MGHEIRVHVVHVEIQEPVIQVIPGAIPVVTQNVRNGLQAVCGMEFVLVAVLAPRILRIDIAADVMPFLVRGIRKRLGNGILVLLDIGHARVHVVVKHRALAGFADENALGVNGFISLGATLLGRASHAGTDHAVPIALAGVGLLVHGELVQHIGVRVELRAVRRQDGLCNVYRNVVGLAFACHYKLEVHA